MRGLLTGSVKAILAIAALSTAAHWALRVQREPAPAVGVVAALPDPVTTGSIEQRAVARAPVAAQPAKASLDQDHLAALIASTSGGKVKVEKAAARR